MDYLENEVRMYQHQDVLEQLPAAIIRTFGDDTAATRAAMSRCQVLLWFNNINYLLLLVLPEVLVEEKWKAMFKRFFTNKNHYKTGY